MLNTCCRELRADTPKEFTDRFRDNVIRINSLIFDNGKENKAFCKDILEVLPETKVDLAYFDPPLMRRNIPQSITRRHITLSEA